ncbi:hypothetical protein B0H11DRAFT_1909783 [Mycena galericulata]|nr:hypothetical protein B0H11DRAFT_1909783 [Mycena galericulata]
MSLDGVGWGVKERPPDQMVYDKGRLQVQCRKVEYRGQPAGSKEHAGVPGASIEGLQTVPEGAPERQRRGCVDAKATRRGHETANPNPAYRVMATGICTVARRYQLGEVNFTARHNIIDSELYSLNFSSVAFWLMSI